MWSWEEWCLWWAMLEEVRNIPEIKSYAQSNCGYCYDTRDAEPGRHAKAEYSPETGGYDYFYMRMVREHNAEKAKVRNRRRADRKHPENKAERMRKMHNRLERKYGYYSCDGGLVHRGFITGELYADGKTRVEEQIARADWELEQDSIAEDGCYVEIEEEYREWERRYRHEKYMRNLNEWLKWA